MYTSFPYSLSPYSPASSVTCRCSSSSEYSLPVNFTVATGGSRVTVALTPSSLFNAFSTCMRQCWHIMPLTLNCFSIVFSFVLGAPPTSPKGRLKAVCTSLSSPSGGVEGAVVNFFFLNLRLFVTTLTLLNAMAAPPIMGLSRKPQTG